MDVDKSIYMKTLQRRMSVGSITYEPVYNMHFSKYLW